MAKIDIASLLDDFESEAREHIDTIESAFVDVSTLIGTSTLMDAVFRAAHSLKGTAGLLSLDKMVTVSHELESIFSDIKDGKLTVNDEITDLVLQSVDCLKELTDHLRDPEVVSLDHIINQLKTYTRPEQFAESVGTDKHPFNINRPEVEKVVKSAIRRGHWIYYLRICFDKSLGKYYAHPNGLLDEIQSVGIIADSLVDGCGPDQQKTALDIRIANALTKGKTCMLELLVTSILEQELFLVAVELDSRLVQRILPDSLYKEEKKVAPELPVELEMNTPVSVRKSDFSIRLDVSVINGLMDMANEMILTRNRLLSLLPEHQIRSVAGLTSVLQDMSRLTGDIQDRVMRSRMQPIGMIFGKFPRMIHDIARLLRKEIAVEIFGDDVALDKYLLDSLSDPITQLVKNSADHGIEDAERRRSLGKPAKGTITLRAELRDGLAVIEISDDGSGIDVSSLRQKSLEKGIVTEDQLAEMKGPALLSLMFEPGISTARHITSVSGRGVGMDIVKTNIENLGGTIEIDSRQDVGTLIRLRMPLTLTVTRTLIIRIDGVPYAVPEANIERLVRIKNGSDVRYLEKVGDVWVLNMDGWIIPAVTMQDLDHRINRTDRCLRMQDITERDVNRETVKCLILKTGNKYFALLIDDAVKTEEILMKPLPVYLQHSRCYSGVTVLGSGHAVMILDAEGILRVMQVAGADRKKQTEATVDPDLQRVIIFQCSGKEYFAFDSDQVSRIERIEAGNIQAIGEEQYVNVGSKTVRIIRPEDYVPVKQRSHQKPFLYLLMLKTGERSVGLLIGRILNQVDESFTLDTSHFENEYVAGTCTYGEKILIMLNAQKIMRMAQE